MKMMSLDAWEIIFAHFNVYKAEEIPVWHADGSYTFSFGLGHKIN